MLLLLAGSAFAPCPTACPLRARLFLLLFTIFPAAPHRFDRPGAGVRGQRVAFTSATSSAAMLTMRRTVADSVST